MLTTQAAYFKDIAIAIRNKLVQSTGLDTTNVVVTASDEWQLANVEESLYLRFYEMNPDTDTGAGRRARPAYRRLRVYVYTRNNLDAYADNIIALFGNKEPEVRCHEDLVVQVLDILDEFIPADAEDSPLVIEPLHPLDSESGPPAREEEADCGMIRSYLDFQIRWLLPNNTPQP